MLRVGMSLRTRLTLWYGVLLALTLLAFSALLYFTLQQSLASSMDERLTLRADHLRREIGPSMGNLLQPEDVAPRQLLEQFVEPGIYVQLLNQKGAILAALARAATSIWTWRRVVLSCRDLQRYDRAARTHAGIAAPIARRYVARAAQPRHDYSRQPGVAAARRRSRVDAQ
jgi:hypothetical protein